MSDQPWLRLVNQPPPMWGQVRGSVEARLIDVATMRATNIAPGTTHGTPSTDEEDYGPFKAWLTAPVRQETHQPDREVVEGQYNLALASDRRPREKWVIRIVCPDADARGVPHDAWYRIEGTVNPRPQPWGGTFIYQLEVRLTEEH